MYIYMYLYILNVHARRAAYACKISAFAYSSINTFIGEYLKSSYHICKKIYDTSIFFSSSQCACGEFPLCSCVAVRLL